MKPSKLRSKIFLDSGDPKETSTILDRLGFLDGQTTNPTLVARNPYAAERLKQDKKFTTDEIIDFYHQVVNDISSKLPNGSVSIEVYADRTTKAAEMVQQAKDFNTWIPNAHIKLPTNQQGIMAAVECLQMNINVNMTLCFSQSQAAAVYAATVGSKRGSVFISPFIGRLDDIGQNGVDLIKNILRMYQSGDGHVEVLSASIRSSEHMRSVLALGTDIVTAPIQILESWANDGMPIPDSSIVTTHNSLAEIPFEDYDLSNEWQSFDLQHELTSKGIDRFANDWNDLIAQQ